VGIPRLSNGRVLLLHPPGQGRARYQLDGYCSQPQKGPFRWHPLDFCAFAARLATDGVEVDIVDLGFKGSAAPANYQGYDAIIGLVGAWGWIDQRRFWREVIEGDNPPVFLSGDLARHEPAYVFDELPGLAGIIPELADPPTLHDLTGSSPRVWRNEQDQFHLPRPAKGFRLGVQPFQAWDLARYRLPFDTPEPFASVFTQVGCPHHCDYCILSTYDPAFRDIDEIFAEFEAAKRAGCRHVYVRDATFNSAPGHYLAVAEQLGSLGLAWNAFARIDGIAEHAELLHANGCRVLQFGIDSPDPEVLADRRKDTRSTDVREALKAVNQAGIRTVGHFVYGLEEPPLSPRAIASYASRVGLDWLTISPLMVRPGTSLWSGTEPERFDSLDARKVPTVLPALLQFYGHPGRIASTTLPTLAKYAAASLNRF
jgi:hypothetical protein